MLVVELAVNSHVDPLRLPSGELEPAVHEGGLLEFGLELLNVLVVVVESVILAFSAVHLLQGTKVDRRKGEKTPENLCLTKTEKWMIRSERCL